MPRLKLALSMLIFGTIGLFVHYIPLPSSVLAGIRAVTGALVMGIVMLVSGRSGRSGKLDMRARGAALKRNALLLFISGAAIGANWVFLFEAYRYTTVAVATLCYYMAPVFVTLLSPLVLKEKLTPLRLICTGLAVAGAVMISGASASAGDIRGVLCGLAAAALYAGVVLMNRFIKDISNVETTFCQLLASSIVIVPYALMTEGTASLLMPPSVAVMALIMGVVHTGLAYLLFFSGVRELPAQTTAVMSYIDPVTAILLSALVLSQPMTLWQAAGAVLILGAMLFGELKKKRKGV